MWPKLLNNLRITNSCPSPCPCRNVRWPLFLAHRFARFLDRNIEFSILLARVLVLVRKLSRSSTVKKTLLIATALTASAHALSSAAAQPSSSVLQSLPAEVQKYIEETLPPAGASTLTHWP